MKMVLNSDAHNCSTYSKPLVSLKYFLCTVVKVTFCEDGGEKQIVLRVTKILSSDKLPYFSSDMCFQENLSFGLAICVSIHSSLLAHASHTTATHFSFSLLISTYK